MTEQNTQQPAAGLLADATELARQSKELDRLTEQMFAQIDAILEASAREHARVHETTQALIARFAQDARIDVAVEANEIIAAADRLEAQVGKLDGIATALAGQRENVSHFADAVFARAGAAQGPAPDAPTGEGKP